MLHVCQIDVDDEIKSRAGLAKGIQILVGIGGSDRNCDQLFLDTPQARDRTRPRATSAVLHGDRKPRCDLKLE